ncbi:hypothetical protein [Pectobacterium jejuense]|uniref:hypothetical protein n=1 Tax=Pectobacterium jejuense TaxID=2974022 RepID=UPI002281C209|nr:hypothetical protein [Pectobacterium jejuense]MCY9850764.1 hypothetical protein [Pectobacterium jejuense]
MENSMDRCIKPPSTFDALLTSVETEQGIATLPNDTLRALAREHHLLVLRGGSSGFSEQ